MPQVPYYIPKPIGGQTAFLLASESISETIMLGLAINQQGYLLLAAYQGEWHLLDLYQYLGFTPKENPSFAEQELSRLESSLATLCEEGKRFEEQILSDLKKQGVTRG